MLSALSGYSTSVEACGPIFGSAFAGCAAGSAGTATRSGGTGDSVTFASLGHTTILGFPATDGYVLYTNAPTSALIDPNNFTVDLNGQTLSFTGFGLKAPSSGGGGSVPEPATLGLLGLGLLGMQLARARRRR
ncbi:MAG: PEP-CTERM sorting domain-containing protein [Gammaproteobacteria bacterium]|nr:PEP-CTERM sorting domain-containing protein [Gammaproteobacteria bacterium]